MNEIGEGIKRCEAEISVLREIHFFYIHCWHARNPAVDGEGLFTQSIAFEIRRNHDDERRG